MKHIDTNIGMVSNLCIGTATFGWTASDRESLLILNASFEHGINFIDTADVYSRWVPGHAGGESETIVGSWLQHIQRDKVLVATKVFSRMGDGGTEGLSDMHITEAVENSLRRLQTDYIDLYQCHHFDYSTPLEETCITMGRLIREGKIRHFGVSNFNGQQLSDLLHICDRLGMPYPATIQLKYNILQRSIESDIFPILNRILTIKLLPWSPLAGGVLTGKYNSDKKRPDSCRDVLFGKGWDDFAYSDRTQRVLDKLFSMEQYSGIPMAQIALAYLYSKKEVASPIIGVSSVDQLLGLIPAADRTLSTEEFCMLDGI